MGIIAWIVFGLIAGAIAKLIMPGDDPGGFIVTIIIGILGAIVGGLIGSMLGLSGTAGTFSFSIGSFFVAILGAILLLWLYRVVKSR